MPDGAAGPPMPAARLNQAIDLLRDGDRTAARDALRTIAALFPDWEEPRVRLAETTPGGDADEPLAAWRTVLAVNPNHHRALLGLGAAAIAAHQPEAAIGPLLRGCGLTPRDPDLWRLLGQAQAAADHHGLAVTAFGHAQRADPASYAILHGLTAAAAAAGELAREAARQQRLSAGDPLNPVPHTIRGLLLDRMGLLDPAIDALDAAVALAPGAREPITVLGGILARTTRAKDAEAALRAALALDPGNPRLMNDRAAVLMRLHRHAEAGALLLEVLRRDGPHASVLCNLATATCCLGWQDEAVDLAYAAILLEPGGMLPHRTLINTLPYQNGIRGARLLAAARRCSALLPRGDPPAAAPGPPPGDPPAPPMRPPHGDPVASTTRPRRADPSASAMPPPRDAPRAPAMQPPHDDPPVPALQLPSANPPTPAVNPPCRDAPARPVKSPSARLTIGLLSGTLRTHPVGWLTIAGLEHLDRDRFGVVCLGRAPEPADPLARRFQTIALGWENVAALDDAALARRTRALGVDILIDLGGHGDAGRMTACARRLAPVQIKWVGMQNHSTGMAEMDWFLTDRWETPPALEAVYSERLLRMPDGYVCYSPPPHAPDPRPPPVLQNGFITFGCYNNIAKITPQVIAVWCRILRAMPGARLVLKTHQFSDPATAARFRAAFAAHDVDPARIETRGSSPHREFLASYHDVDIVLDPFPYSGGLTTCEALWMGVPTVTLPGEIFASRHSLSHLSNAGYADWAAQDEAGYVRLVLEKARDPAGLARLRTAMREQVRASPLCDAPRFGRALGRALRHAWTA